MAIMRYLLGAVVFSYLVNNAIGEQQCIPLKDSLLEVCSFAGYNTTFPIPSDIKLSEKSKQNVQGIISYMLQSTENCSVARSGESVICALIAPYCRPEGDKPFLPCRRVCSEFMKRCGVDPGNFWIDYFMAACSLFSNKTAESGECYEPDGFADYYNSSTTGKLESGCTKMIFPFCKGVGFTYTAITTSYQLMIYQFYYGKKFTNTSTDSIIPPNSYIGRIQQLGEDFPKCADRLRRFFCGDQFPPCFPEEGPRFYTICQQYCHQLGLECPGLYNTFIGRYVSACEILAFGNTSHGFCKHTTWPTPMKWLKWFRDQPQPQPTSVPLAPATKVYVIVVAVVVPIILIALIVLGFLAWRQHRLPIFCLKGQDKEDLVK
ncbi:uncharacterized protein LOC116611635 [Nematostella vectensis]|uniref:uncharacterized protein LOC116611635 n=1 Tax=Nematostella vectensis TaxID=45351 RepID=UPI002077045C|nr:uncharacterized protein LOC116611635 [Nematostella vectensis]